MDIAALPPDNATGIAIAIARAKAQHYVVPSVNQIFAAGIPVDQVNKSLFFDGRFVTPATLWPKTIAGSYYNFSTLWPFLEISGPIFHTAENCTPDICSLLFGNFLYQPNVPANIFFAAFFAAIMLVSVPLSVRGRNWGYLIGITLGLVCEVLGYVGRVLISRNDFTKDPFYIYIICLTIGPAFLSFSIYTCLARIVVVYGSQLSRLKPRSYTYIFAMCDLISLVLQGAGGGIAATADDSEQTQKGVNIMIAGLAFQVFSLFMFMTMLVDYGLNVRRHRDELNPSYSVLRHTKRFKGFLVALGTATVTIFIRSVFRVAELKQGFHSRFANEQISFMILEAGMIAVAAISLTAFHPALVFKEQWREISHHMSGNIPAKIAFNEKWKESQTPPDDPREVREVASKLH